MNAAYPAAAPDRARIVKREWARAALHGDAPALRSQISAGADVDAHDRFGQSALMLAARGGHLEAVEVPIAAGANLNTTAKFSLSATMLAVINDHQSVARVLAAAGADLSIAGSGAPGFAGKTVADFGGSLGSSKKEAHVLRDGSANSIAVTRGDPDVLDAVIDVLEEAAASLWGRGIHQWEPGSIRLQRPTLLAWAKSGALVVAIRGGELVGACFLVREPNREWAHRPGPALYLHKLVVARSHSGSGVATRLLEWCQWQAQEMEVPRIRLDCWDGNARLRAYYTSAGYTELDAVASHGYEVRLFELEV